MNFPFKDNKAAFEYASNFLVCTVEVGAMLPALVEDGRSLFGTQDSVHLNGDGTQTAVVKIASSDGGFLVLARTVGLGPTLKPGDLVAWQAGAYLTELAETAGDRRFGWVGLILGTLSPEWRDGSWVGAEQFRP